MNDEALQERRRYHRLYMREWRKRNPSKVRQYNRNYWERRGRSERQPIPIDTLVAEIERLKREGANGILSAEHCR